MFFPRPPCAPGGQAVYFDIPIQSEFLPIFMIFSDAPEQILKYETSTADEIKNHAVGVVLLASFLRAASSCLLLHPPNISSLFA